MSVEAIADPQPRGRFEVHAVEVMRRLRAAFLRMMEGLSEPARRAADLERSLKVSRTLAWQIHRVATSPNPLAAGAHMPGNAAVRGMLRAARGAGVPEPVLREVADAMEAFEALIDRHAGDRDVFATMVDSLAGREAEGIDLRTRREAYRVNSRAWGVQVKTFLACGILHPGRRPSEYDIVLLRGLREIRRLRPGAPLRLSSQRVVDAHQYATEPHTVDGHAPADAVGPNLLLDFCTQPLPELDSRFEGGCVHTYLRETPLGNAGAQTFYLADVTRGVEWKRADATPNHHIRSASIMKPIEVLVLDTLIHRGMYGSLEPQAAVFGSLDRLGETDPYQFRSDETLPIPVEVNNLGAGLAACATPHVPRYREMVDSVCGQLGWDPEAFEVFRCVLEYPLLNSMVTVHFELPEEGNW